MPVPPHPDPPRAPDFSRREFDLPELLDEPCSFATWAAASRSLARLNRWTGAYRPATDFLRRVLARRGPGAEPLHVLDCGCGHGDTLRRIHRWAARRGVPLRLTGVDRNPNAARLAHLSDREEGLSPGAVTWITADLFDPALPDRLPGPPDVILCSLFTHHLDDATVVQFLRWAERHARLGWFINDLERSERAARLYRPLAVLLGAHPFLRHDGPVSFRRAFRRDDWQRFLLAARLDPATVRLFGSRPARLCLERLR